MERTQVTKSEQITPNLSMVIDYDQPLLSSKDILKAFKNALGENCSIEKFQNTKTVYKYEHNGITEYFLAGSVTYLSKPHPIFKKCYQLKTWFKDFYKEYSTKANTRIRFIGIYHYDGLVVFVDFNSDDYINRKLNSSAAHVFSNDIYQALTNDLFEKKDKNDNRITVVPSRNFKKYLDGNISGNNLFDWFKKFNSGLQFGQWITAVQAIEEMKQAKWYTWRETEWAGWFLEYKMCKFINEENCSDCISYTGNIKNKDALDFDLYFKEYNFYGDLKASDITKEITPGNDQENILKAISQCGKLWYIIYEHETVKDTDKNNEMAKARMKLIGNEYVEGGHISYASRMKYSVKFKKMQIFELNRVNMNETLTAFNQGRQPSGDARRPKFSINKKNIDNYIVFSYEF